MTRIELLQTVRLVDAPGSSGGGYPRGEPIRQGDPQFKRVGGCAGFKVRDTLQQGGR